MAETSNASKAVPDDSVNQAPEASYMYTGIVTDIHKTHSIPFTFPFPDPTSVLSTCSTAQDLDTDAKNGLLTLIKALRSTHHAEIFKAYRFSAGSSVSRPCGVCSFQNLGRYRRVAVDLYYVFSTCNLSEGKLVVRAVPVCKDMMGNCRRRAHDSLRGMLEAEMVGTGSAVFVGENVVGALVGTEKGNLGCELCGRKTVEVMKRCTRCKVAQ
jgi:hypothetical protein